MAESGFVFISTTNFSSVNSATFTSLPTNYIALEFVYRFSASGSSGITLSSPQQTSNQYYFNWGKRFLESPSFAGSTTRDNQAQIEFSDYANAENAGAFKISNLLNNNRDVLVRGRQIGYETGTSTSGSYLSYGGGFSRTSTITDLTLATRNAGETMTGTVDIYGWLG